MDSSEHFLRGLRYVIALAVALAVGVGIVIGVAL